MWQHSWLWSERNLPRIGCKHKSGNRPESQISKTAVPDTSAGGKEFRREETGKSLMRSNHGVSPARDSAAVNSWAFPQIF